MTESAVKSTTIQEGLYTSREIAPNYKLLWRILKDVQEIEVVMQIKGTGYAAIGWRAKDAEASCKALPRIVDPLHTHGGHEHRHDHVHAEPEGEPEGEAEGEPEGEAESEAEAEAESQVRK